MRNQEILRKFELIFEGKYLLYMTYDLLISISFASFKTLHNYIFDDNLRKNHISDYSIEQKVLAFVD